MGHRIADHAAVIGAGMAGLAAAAALSGYFHRVTLIDRDDLPTSPAPRPGTPQARQVHVLLGGGVIALSTLLPGFEQDLDRAGAVRARVGSEIRLERLGFDPFPVRDLGWDTLCLTRPLLEFTTRQRVDAITSIQLLSRCRVTELVASSDGASVIGVRYDDANGAQTMLAADLIVDASSRGVLTWALLERVGMPRPEESEIGIDLAYATAQFAIPDNAPQHWKALIHSPSAPTSSRGAFVFPVEQHRWVVGLSGNHGDAPPADLDGFIAYASTLRTPTVYQAIRNASPVGQINRFVLPSSLRRHVERLAAFPRGLLPIGDVICRFNPAFGQGMSVAAQEAVVLAQVLESRAGDPDPLDGLATRFFAGIQDVLISPWSAAESDLVYPKTRGTRPPDFERRLQYGAALSRLAADDPALHKEWTEVAHLIKPAAVLRTPELVGRVTESMRRQDLA